MAGGGVMNLAFLASNPGGRGFDLFLFRRDSGVCFFLASSSSSTASCTA